MSLVVKGLEYEPIFLWDQTNCKQNTKGETYSQSNITSTDVQAVV